MSSRVRIKTKNAGPGFTLIELVVSIALFVVLLGILWNVISLFWREQTQGTRLAERSQLVRSLAQLLEDDLRAAIQDPIHPHRGDRAGDDDIRRFGLSGSAQSMRIDVIEINPFAVDTPPEPRMARFGEIVSSEPRAAELKTVFYDFSPGTGLSRREIDFETPDIDAAGPEGSNMFAPEVIDCRFRYFNGSAWSDSWDSLQREGLPVAIEATLRSLPLAEAAKLRRGIGNQVANIDQLPGQPDLPAPVQTRIVAYLPASPVRKFEAYRRATPPKKDDVVKADPPPPVSSALDVSPPPSPAPGPVGPQQSWIRGQ